MALRTRDYSRSFGYRSGLPRGIQALLIANTALFLLQFFAGRSVAAFFDYLVLVPYDVVHSLRVWELGTFLFVNPSILGFLWNMLALWMFGKELEESWGTDRFLKFYFLCGSGGGLCVLLAQYALGNPAAASMGADAAIYGILAASGTLWPEREVIFFFFPMKMKYFVWLIAGVDFLLSYHAGIGSIAVLTGLLWGYLYVRSRRRSRGPSFRPMASLEASYKAWKLKRARRKFQVYLRKHGSKQDPWVH